MSTPRYVTKSTFEKHLRELTKNKFEKKLKGDLYKVNLSDHFAYAAFIAARDGDTDTIRKILNNHGGKKYLSKGHHARYSEANKILTQSHFKDHGDGNKTFPLTPYDIAFWMKRTHVLKLLEKAGVKAKLSGDLVRASAHEIVEGGGKKFFK